MGISDHAISPALSILLYDPVNKTWYFEKFIFEVEASYSFKITCILVRQLIPFIKNGGVINKKILFNVMVSYFYSFHRCTSISEDGRYLSHSNIDHYESGHLWRTPYIRTGDYSDRTPFF